VQAALYHRPASFIATSCTLIADLQGVIEERNCKTPIVSMNRVFVRMIAENQDICWTKNIAN